MRTRQKALSLLLALALAAAPVTAAAYEAAPEEDEAHTEARAQSAGEPEAQAESGCPYGSAGASSGRCGDGVTWTLDSQGQLTISGNGDMWDNAVSDNPSVSVAPPWYDRCVTAVIGEGVTRIGAKAFIQCSSLEHVLIMGDVRSVGANAFAWNHGLKSVDFMEGGPCEIEKQAFVDCPAMTELSLAEGVVSIGRQTFWGCSGLTELTLPKSLTAIESGAFEKCSGLTEVVIPDNVTSVGAGAFKDTLITKVTAPASLTLPEDAFPAGAVVTPSGGGETGGGETGGGETGGGETGSGETGGGETGGGETGGGEDPGPIAPDPSATVRESGDCGKNGSNVTYQLYTDGTLVISGTGDMETFYVPNEYGATITTPYSWRQFCVRAVIEEGVTSVGGYAFSGCSHLESAYLPDSVQSIGEQAFYTCSALDSIRLPEELASIGNHAFRETALKTVKLPKGLKTVGDYAFFSCAALTEAELPEGLNTIGVYAFGSCAALTAMELPEGLLSIGTLAFYGCEKLESVSFPDSLTSIGDAAFSGCAALTEVTLPRNLQSLGKNAFQASGLVRARVYYELDYTPSAFPSGCAVELYGRDLTPDAPLEAVRTAPAGSANIHAQTYGNWSAPVKSCLAPRDGGGFYRVDYYSRYNSAKKDWDIDLVMEAYDRRGNFLRGWNIPRELPVFGGFFAGSDGFYFVFGQHNPNEQNGTEVIRVVKYTKSLERLGEASLTAGPSREIWSVFSGASLRMAEGNGTLFIHTGSEAYAGSDGLHHQSDLLLAVDTATMTPLPVPFSLSSFASHSFNQFVQADGDLVAVINHGDTFPRGVQLALFPASLSGSHSAAVIMDFGGQMANNYTGAAVGGFEVSPTHYLTAVSSINQDSFSSSKTYNVSLLATDKSAGTTRRVQVTSYAEGGSVSASAPQLTRFSDGLFALLWEERIRDGSSYSYTQTTGAVKYAFFDGAGNQLGGVRSMSGALSDCKPEIIDGKAVWYVTENGGAPVFYQINSAGGSSSFRPGLATGVELPESVLTKLGSCETVLAASHNAQGRLAGALRGVLEDGSAEFGQSVPKGWTLYFLDGGGAPVCRPYPVS